MQIEPDLTGMIAAKLLASVNAPEQEIYRVAREIFEMTSAHRLATRPDDSSVERVIAAVEATGLLAGDEARDVARAAIAALGDSGGL